MVICLNVWLGLGTQCSAKCLSTLLFTQLSLLSCIHRCLLCSPLLICLLSCLISCLLSCSVGCLFVCLLHCLLCYLKSCFLVCNQLYMVFNQLVLSCPFCLISKVFIKLYFVRYKKEAKHKCYSSKKKELTIRRATFSAQVQKNF